MSVYIEITVTATNLTSIIIASHKNIANWNEFSSVIQTECSFLSAAFLYDLITLHCFLKKKEKRKGRKKIFKGKS